MALTQERYKKLFFFIYLDGVGRIARAKGHLVTLLRHPSPCRGCGVRKKLVLGEITVDGLSNWM